MIKGVHTMFYSSDAPGLRDFLRDKLNLKATDVGGGWLITVVISAFVGFCPEEAHEMIISEKTKSRDFFM